MDLSHADVFIKVNTTLFRFLIIPQYIDFFWRTPRCVGWHIMESCPKDCQIDYNIEDNLPLLYFFYIIIGFLSGVHVAYYIQTQIIFIVP
jgi:hypothetical protein